MLLLGKLQKPQNPHLLLVILHVLNRGVKTFEGTLSDLNVAALPVIGTRAVCGTWLALRAEIIAMLEMKRKLVSRQSTSTPASSADARSKRGPKGRVSHLPNHYPPFIMVPKG